MSVGYLPFSPLEIEIICNETEFRPIWHYGVELNGRQKYNSPALADLRIRIGVSDNGRSKAEIKIKAKKFDIGRIWIFNPFEKIWIEIPNVNLEYAEGLTLHQHKIIQKYAREMYKESDDYQVLIEAKEKMRQYVAQLSVAKSLADRKKSKKIVGSTSRTTAQASDKTIQPEEKFISDQFSKTTLERTPVHESFVEDVRCAKNFENHSSEYACVKNKSFQKGRL